MKTTVFLSSLAVFLSQFVQYKQALTRKYHADVEVLRLFDRYLHNRHIAGRQEIDGALIGDFLKSRPRVRAGQLQPSSRCAPSLLRLRHHAGMDTVQSRNGESAP